MYNSARPTVFHRRSQRKRSIIGGLFFIGILILTVVGATQLSVIREFFSKADGEPANIHVDTKAIIGPMPQPWRNLAQGGEDHAWRLEPLVDPVKALNPEYIRIDHIYDFYDVVKGESGNLTFDFSKLDLLLNDIEAAGAKPFISLSYLPPALAQGDIVSEPKNYAEWQLLVQKTIEHVSGTRGTRDVYYEVWNEPDLFGGWKYYGEKNYLDLYSYASRGARAAQNVQPFKLGGPATTALYKNWFDALAEHAITNNLKYDFFSWHRYSSDVERFKQDVVEVQDWIQQYPQLEPTLEFLITEWGHDSENSPGYDNNYSAAHSVAAASEMVAIVQKAFVFEIQDGKDPNGQAMWGRWGLFTHNNFGAQAKPRYQALKMLDEVGNQRLQLQGKGTWVKGLAALNAADNPEVVLANFDPDGKHAEVVPVTFDNIVPGDYTIIKTLLGGQQQVEKVATTAAVLRTYLTMPANSVGSIELDRN